MIALIIVIALKDFWSFSFLSPRKGGLRRFPKEREVTRSVTSPHDRLNLHCLPLDSSELLSYHCFFLFLTEDRSPPTGDILYRVFRFFQHVL